MEQRKPRLMQIPRILSELAVNNIAVINGHKFQFYLSINYGWHVDVSFCKFVYESSHFMGVVWFAI